MSRAWDTGARSYMGVGVFYPTYIGAFTLGSEASIERIEPRRWAEAAIKGPGDDRVSIDEVRIYIEGYMKDDCRRASPVRVGGESHEKKDLSNLERQSVGFCTEYMTDWKKRVQADLERTWLIRWENIGYTMQGSISEHSSDTVELCRRCVAGHPRLRPPGFLALYLLAARPSESRAGAYLGNRIPRGARRGDPMCALGGEMAGAISGIECSDALEPVQGRRDIFPVIQDIAQTEWNPIGV